MENLLTPEQTPRFDSRNFFKELISKHTEVLDITQLGVPLFTIERFQGKTLNVLLVDIYIISEAEILDLLSRYSDIDAIVNISMWNKNTTGAKELAKEQQIGIFMLNEFMGALNYDNKKAFLNYVPPHEREENQRRNKNAF